MRVKGLNREKRDISKNPNSKFKITYFSRAWPQVLEKKVFFKFEKQNISAFIRTLKSQKIFKTRYFKSIESHYNLVHENNYSGKKQPPPLKKQLIDHLLLNHMIHFS